MSEARPTTGSTQVSPVRLEPTARLSSTPAAAKRAAYLSDKRHDLVLTRRISLIAQVVALILVLFIIAYCVFTVKNSSQIASEMESVQEGPYPVSVAAGHVETALVHLRTMVEHTSLMPGIDSPEDLAAAFDDINYYLDNQLDIIYKAHDNLDLPPTRGTAPLAEGEFPEVVRQLDRAIGTGSVPIPDNMETLPLEGAYTQEEVMRLYQNELKAREVIYVRLLADPAVSSEEMAAYGADSLVPLINSMLVANAFVVDQTAQAIDSAQAAVIGINDGTFTLVFLFVGLVLTSLLIYISLLRYRSHLEQQLRSDLEETLALAESANVAKTSFMANVSHDVRTPLNAIIGLTTVAEAHIDDTRYLRDALHRIDISSKQLLGLINDVLDMGRIESGEVRLHEEAFSFPTLIGEFINIMHPQAKAKGLDFVVSVGNTSQETLVGDAVRINQVLFNIVSNAIKFTDEGGTVSLDIREKSEGDPAWRTYVFRIADTGIGMEKAFMDKLFIPFERAANDTTRFAKGTGLGMAITKNVIDLMGGTIEVHSTPGEGSVFTVELPLRLGDEKAQEAQEDVLEGVRLLLIDDDAAVCEATAEMVRGLKGRADWSTEVAEGIGIAIAAEAEGDPYSAIMVDLVMPEYSGLQIAADLRSQLGNEVPIILFTAYDWAGIEDEARAAGITDFMAKPLYRQRLLQTLRRNLRGEAAAAEEAMKAAANNGKKGSKDKLKGRVLLVEDNELNSEIAVELIGQYGVEVDVAEDGREGYDRFCQAPEGTYQLIYMDWQMPRMNGGEATEAILAYEKSMGWEHVPIVCMTANAFQEDRDRAQGLGMDGFIAKPISMRELDASLRKFLPPAE